jgi:hypothetical protein
MAESALNAAPPVRSDHGDGDVEEFWDTHITPRELSERAMCRLQMVYNYMKAGRIPFVRNESTHHRYMIPSDRADEWIESYKKRKAERRAAQR